MCVCVCMYLYTYIRANTYMCLGTTDDKLHRNSAIRGIYPFILTYIHTYIRTYVN